MTAIGDINDTFQFELWNSDTTQNQPIVDGNTRYYTNARGVNYLPIIKSQWEKSGYLPRFSNQSSWLALGGLGAFGFDTSNSFLGTNKTASWWYYNHNDNDFCIRTLRSLGINCIRVFLDIYVWHRQGSQFINNLKDFMKICDKHKIRVQFVIWDQIHINSGFDVPPQQRPETTSALESGLLAVWQGNPLSFEVSSLSQSLDFYTTCAVPYVTDVISNVSSFQSLWSFDVMNEPLDNAPINAMVSSTGLYVSSLLSGANIGITIGYGSTYDQFSGSLFGNVNFVYPNTLTTMSSVINFASIHPYILNTFTTARELVLEASQAYSITRNPSMYNEAVNPDYGMFANKLIEYFSSIGYGGLMFDGFVDYALSYEPFREFQGLVHPDGTSRRAADTSAYVNFALSKGWFSPLQLNRNIVEKDISINDGSDGGYYSGVIPEHQEFNSSLYTSTTESKWNVAKTLIYTTFPAFGITKSSNSKNYSVLLGHPLRTSVGSISYIASGFTTQDYLDICRNYSTYFPPLSSYSPALFEGADFVKRNKEIRLRDLTLLNIAIPIFAIGLGQPRDRLIGTQYDKNLAPSSVRLDFSSVYYAYLRSDGSSLNLAINSAEDTITSASIPCILTSSCIYNTPQVSSTGINWSGYDMYYDTVFTKLNNCLSYYLSSTSPNARLY